jgi:hypothetical protein
MLKNNGFHNRHSPPFWASVLSLFSNGEQGAWYDPSDISTMFQDSAGTTPVTAVEQSVGLILDRSQGLVRGSELRASGVVGLIGTATVASYSTATGDGSVSRGADANNQSYVQFSGLVANASYEFTLTITSGSLFIRSGNHLGSQFALLGIGAKRQIIPASALGVITVTSMATNNSTAFFESISVRELPGNHALQATALNRPIYRKDAAEKAYLAFDGSNDALATASLNFTATDKMTVWAGVRKLSDVARGMIVELSATSASNNGSFGMTAPNAASATYAFESKGTALTDAVGTPFTAPLTSVLTGVASIASDVNILRVNSTQADSDTGDQGTGNYGNYPLYIGSRGGTSLPFNGNLYSLIVRGAQSSEYQIAATENYVNGKTGAY